VGRILREIRSRETRSGCTRKTTARGQKSNFNEIVSRETVTERGARSRSEARKSSSRAGSETGRRSARAAKKRRAKPQAQARAAPRKRSSAGKTSARKIDRP
jgi:hypothetical protein